MPNFFYIDASDQKRGPISNDQLRTLVAQGAIGPNTPMEAETGQKGLAGQIPGLFATAPNPFTTAGPQPVPVPPAKKRNPALIIGIGVIAFLAAPLVLAFVLAIGKAIMSGSSPTQAGSVPMQQPYKAEDLPAQNPTVSDPARAKEAMKYVEWETAVLETGMENRFRTFVATNPFGGKFDETRREINNLCRKIETDFDAKVAECPPNFQLAFEKYKEVVRNYKDAIFEMAVCHQELEDSRYETGAIRTDAKQREKDASRAFDRAKEKLTDAREEMKRAM